MKRATRVLLAGGLLLGSVEALAVDLDNQDRREYEVKIRSGPGSTLNSKIYGNNIQKGVCSKCELEVVGVGKAQVSGAVTVIIKDGKLSIRR